MTLDFVVLTGFLGSGKTTLLRDFLALPESADTAVIVNEAGEIGLDGAILREGAPGAVAMAMLSNGCVCCAMGSDLAMTVEALLAADRPGAGPLRRIVLETSGLSKPGPVLRQLASLAHLRMRVGVVATYDAERGAAVAGFAEAAAQWAGADTIVVTKADRVGAGRLPALAREVAAVNPLARVIATAGRDDAIGEVFCLSARKGGLEPVSLPDDPVPHSGINVLLARTAGIVAYDDLAAWLDNLAGFAGERLLRLKGLVRVAGWEGAALVQSVGTMFSPPRPFGAPGTESFMVIIGHGLLPAEVLSVTPGLGLAVSGGGVTTRPVLDSRLGVSI